MDAEAQVIDLQSYLAVPYRDGGRSRNGADCYGIGWLYNAEHGRALPRYSAITAADTPTFLRAVAEGRATWREITPADREPGDAVLLRRRLWTLPLHLGWAVEDGRVLSTTRATGAHLTEWRGIDVEDRQRGIYRYE